MIRKERICLKIIKYLKIVTFSKSNREPIANVANKIMSLEVSLSSEKIRTINTLNSKNERSMRPFVLKIYK